MVGGAEVVRNDEAGCVVDVLEGECLWMCFVYFLDTSNSVAPGKTARPLTSGNDGSPEAAYYIPNGFAESEPTGCLVYYE